MHPKRSLAILNKLKDIHESNPHLAMSDISNDEIVKALDTAINCVKFLIKLACKILDEEKTHYE